MAKIKYVADAPVTLEEKLRNWYQRERLLIHRGIIAALVLTLLGLGWYFWSARQDQRAWLALSELDEYDQMAFPYVMSPVAPERWQELKNLLQEKQLVPVEELSRLKAGEEMRTSVPLDLLEQGTTLLRLRRLEDALARYSGSTAAPFLRYQRVLGYYRARDWARCRSAMEELSRRHPGHLVTELVKSNGTLGALPAGDSAGPAAWPRPKTTPPAPQAVVHTTRGDLTFLLLEDDAPLAVANFITLADAHFYDGLFFYRAEANRSVAVGCPLGTGQGEPGYFLPEEKNGLRHLPGMLAMEAGQDRRQSGSRVALSLAANQWSEEGTVFGKILAGLEVAEKLTTEDRVLGISITGKRDTDYASRVKKL